MAVSFDFQERLEAGHFGEVWRVIDTGLGVERALKVIPPRKVLNPANFFHEAQILKTVEHPNIVRVEDTGQLDGGRVYVAMEYLRKGSLEDESKGAYVELTRAKRLMIDVLRGLEHAHSRGVLHRDIKPANILIGQSLEGKLSDFGLAIPVGLNLKSLGVKEYAYVVHMAPELYEGKPHTVATDIYACGVTLYRIVNGDAFFVLPPPDQLEDCICNGDFPDRNAYRDFVPLPLRRLINQGLALMPHDRFKSASEMRRALERLVIEKNWVERKLVNGTEWRCGWDKKCYEVQCLHGSHGKWIVSVKKGPSRFALRRQTALCAEGLTEDSARKRARRILQDFVLGKLK
jgi:serine/threonine protein kinase